MSSSEVELEQPGALSLPEEAQPRPWTRSLDLTLSSLFLIAAAVILAVLTPVNVRFEARPVETLVVVLVAGLVLGYGVLRRNVPIILIATAALFAVMLMGVVSQPTTFDSRPGMIWPLRLFILLVIATGWALLLAPPRLLRRAVIAVSISTTLMLLAIGGATMANQTSASADPDGMRLNNNFAASYLVMDGKDTLYAADLEGSLIWVFDPSGNVRGTIRPAAAPPVPTPGPGIIPPGMEYELSLPGAGGTVQKPQQLNFTFCGMTVDAQNNLYLVDANDFTNPKLLRFNPEGMITARWPTPSGYRPGGACLASDAEHIYLLGVGGSVHALDYSGTEVARGELKFEPWAASDVTGDKSLGTVVVSGPGTLVGIEVRDGKIVTNKLAAPPLEYQLPMLVLRNGEILLSDHQGLKVVRWDPRAGKVLGTFGEPGLMPGQFGDIGGMAEDSAGRVYVADPVNRAIQRFGTGGRVDAVWSAQDPNEAGENR